MTTNDDIYNYVLDVVRKEKEGNSLSIPRFNRLLQASEIEYRESQYKLYELSQEITDTLNVIKASSSAAISSGAIAKTNLSNYWHLISATTGGTNIEVLTEAEWRYRNSSALFSASSDYPYCRVKSDEIEFAGLADAVTVDFVFFQVPASAVAVYNLDGNDNLVYDSGSSVELPYNDTDKKAIADLILQKLSVSLKETASFQFAQIQEQKDSRP